MKKFKLLPLLLVLLLSLFLVSCSSKVEITSYVDTVTVKYTRNSTLSSNDTLKGTITYNDTSSLKDYYIITYTYDYPYTSNSYTENTLLKVTKEELQVNSNYSFEITLDLEKMFNANKNEVYIVIHSSEFDRTNIASYNVSTISYSWNGNKVEISE